MTGQEWAEIAAMGFALAVLAWAVFRLTGVLVRIFDRLFSAEAGVADSQRESEPADEAEPDFDDDIDRSS